MSKKVTIYSRTTCAYCGMVKKYLGMKNVEYEEVNLDEHPDLIAGVVAKSGAQTVPITMVQDENSEQEAIVVGWNPAKLAEALA